MPLQRPPKYPPKTDQDWDQWVRSVQVSPDDETVTTDKIVDLAVTTPKIAENAISNGKFRDSAANSVIGRSASTTGDPADIAIATGQFLGTRAGVTGGYALTDTDIPTGIARDTEVATAIAAHEAAPDPHPQYLTQTEGDVRYRELTDAVTYAELTGKPAGLALVFSGTGTPEAVVTAGIGSLFLRTDGGAGTSFYVKESGAGNTGWIAK